MPQTPTLLMTRPEPASKRFVAMLPDSDLVGLRVEISPLIRIVPRGDLPDMAGYRGVVFTSANGVRAYLNAGGRCDLPAFAVGGATAAAARAAGIDTVSAKGDAGALVALLAKDGPDGPLLHARGVHGVGDVAARLTGSGLPTDEAVLYDQQPQDLTPGAKAALEGSAPVILPVFSPRTGALFLRAIPVKAPLLVAAISQAVAKTVAPLHSHSLKIADRPDADAMRGCVCDLIAQAQVLVGQRGKD